MEVGGFLGDDAMIKLWWLNPFDKGLPAWVGGMLIAFYIIVGTGFIVPPLMWVFSRWGKFWLG